MTIKEIEQTEEYKQWAKDLLELNDTINALPEWDAYAERLQARYDDLMFNKDPRRKKWK